MYFIAIVAPEDINKQVLKWKLWMKERYQCVVALRSLAHITLVPPFWMDPALEQDLISSMTIFASQQEKFLVQSAQFSHFGQKVIFIDVTRSDALTRLPPALYEFLLSVGKYPLKQEERSFHPHITVATRDLHKKAFNEAWEHFKEKEYKAGWLAGDISLLRHNGTDWDVIARASFV